MCYLFQQVDNLDAQIADVLAERSKATETISSLRVRAVTFTICWFVYLEMKTTMNSSLINFIILINFAFLFHLSQHL